jgi:hypothetical protein
MSRASAGLGKTGDQLDGVDADRVIFFSSYGQISIEMAIVRPIDHQAGDCRVGVGVSVGREAA